MKDKKHKCRTISCAAFAALGERLYGDEYGWVILMGFEASENSEFLLGVLGFRNDNGVFDVFLGLTFAGFCV
ncbi:MAG: hypothetical protein IIW86_06340, partial [Clostridia bacterium]|nr:hypothetical protein [Clostridia bacterium]